MNQGTTRFRQVVINPSMRDLALSRASVDRSAHLRSKTDEMRAAMGNTNSRTFAVHRGMAQVNQNHELVFLTEHSLDDHSGWAYLGTEGDISYFCLFVDEDFIKANDPESWRNLRVVGAQLSDRDAGLMVTGVALDNWHALHTHCPRCGAGTVISESGWTRTCPRDNSVHFPRTDPAVIMAVTDHQDRILLARQARWEPGWMSVLAGFVESGESIEAAVIREIAEESGVDVDPQSVTYIGSQPWPFPNSLMLGFTSQASDKYGDEELIEVRVDGEEIVHAQWFSREELKKACIDGEVHLPPPVSIAHRIIVQWFGEPLPRESKFR